jgi:hypothetical protein
MPELQGSHALEDGEGAPAAVREREDGMGRKGKGAGAAIYRAEL